MRRTLRMKGWRKCRAHHPSASNAVPHIPTTIRERVATHTTLHSCSARSAPSFPRGITRRRKHHFLHCLSLQEASKKLHLRAQILEPFFVALPALAVALADSISLSLSCAVDGANMIAKPRIKYIAPRTCNFMHQ